MSRKILVHYSGKITVYNLPKTTKNNKYRIKE